MSNETVEGLAGISFEWRGMVLLIVAAVIAIITAVIKGLFQDEILSFINYARYFKKIVLYKNAEKLQQSDFGIQHTSGANKDVYKRKNSDDEIENYLKDSKDLLIIGMPKAGKTRSAYQAMKLVLPEFCVIRPPAEKLPDFIFPRFKKNYLIFFDDLNKFTDVDFDFKRFLDKFRSKSNRMIVLSTCRSGDELDTVKSKSMEFFRRFEIVDLNNYPLSEAEGEQLAKDVGVEWKPEQFNGTPGSVILDDEDMKERYRHLDDRQKAILRTCKLLRSANIFTYKKDLIKNVCDRIFEIKIGENNWIDSISKLGSSSLITEQGKSINNVNVYDSTLDSVVYDYSLEDHLPPLLALLIELKDAENLFYLGNAFHEKKDYGNAEKSYKKSLEFNPDVTTTHYNLGNLLNDLKRYNEAEEEYRGAIRVDPDLAAAHYNLGNLLKDLKRYDEAEEEWRGAIRVDPDLAAAHCNLGILLKDQGRYDEAEEEYRDAIRVDSDDAASHYNLGNLLNDLKRYDEAEEEYRDAIRVDSDDAAAHYNLGNLLNDQGRHDDAEEEWRYAIRADPDYAEAHANLGILFLATERPKEAKKEFEIAKELFKNQGRDEDVKKVEELLPPT
jgi:tetratricopeptide (TPR) repeat protein